MKSNNQDLYVRLGRALKRHEQLEKRTRNADFNGDKWFWRIVRVLTASVSLLLFLFALGFVAKIIGGSFPRLNILLIYIAYLCLFVIGVAPLFIVGLEIIKLIRRLRKPLDEKLVEDANETDWLWRGSRFLSKFSKVQLIQTKERLETRMKDFESRTSSAISFYQFSPVIITALVVGIALAVIPDSVFVESLKQQNVFDGTKVVSSYIVNTVSFDFIKIIIVLYLILPAHIPLISAVNYKRTQRLKNSIALLQQAIAEKAD